jgi:hypothetical protein
MRSRHLIAAPVILLLGVLAYANTDRPAFAGIALLTAAAIGAPYLWVGVARNRAAERIAREAERRAAGPLLLDYTHDRDRLWEDLERRRLAG